VNQKVEGKEVTAAGPEIKRAQVIDLMEALKQSLAKRVAGPPVAEPAARATAAEKKPLAKAKRTEPAPAKRAQAGKK
jgi:non-homologous end joining protein Ku